jgi:hypothetical protein
MSLTALTRHLLTIHIGITFRLRIIAVFTHVVLSMRVFLFGGKTELDEKRASGLRYILSDECFSVCSVEL